MSNSSAIGESLDPKSTETLDSENIPTAAASNTDTTKNQEEDVMATPENVKNSSNVHKRYCADMSLTEVKNLDCLLVADTCMECVCQPLENLLQHLEGSKPSQAELIFILVYAVALESGFVSLKTLQSNKSMIKYLPATSSYHSKNVLCLSLLPPLYIKSEGLERFSLKLRSLIDVEMQTEEDVFSLLVGFVCGDYIILTLSPSNSTGANGFSVALPIGRYVLSMHSKNKPVFQRFRKLHELSLVLRDKLFTPMRNQHLCRLAAVIYPSLNGMPPELYDNILKYLSYNQLKILANVNKTLYNTTVCSKHMLKYLQQSTSPRA
uniref:F-box domain-containing protein n=1 Tax=Stomoxys calcitrans TaxID=35570 RepID=A0A1I8P4M1_STOCA